MALRNDYRSKAETFALLDAREEAIFDRYIAVGKYKQVVHELAEELGKGMTERTFYDWLEASDERWANWQKAKKIRGHISSDEAEEVVEQATQQTANVDRLKYEAKMRAAEWQNREVFGKRPDVAVAVMGVGGEWAGALGSVFAQIEGNARGSAGIAGAHPSAHTHTRALPAPELAPRTVPDVSSES
jgi:hypothetical protein